MQPVDGCFGCLCVFISKTQKYYFMYRLNDLSEAYHCTFTELGSFQRGRKPFKEVQRCN